MHRNRSLIGIGTAAVFAIGAWSWATDRTGLAGATLRVGAVMAALFIAWPVLTDFDWRRSWWVPAAMGIVAWRPRAAWLVIPVLILVAARRPSDR